MVDRFFIVFFLFLQYTLTGIKWHEKIENDIQMAIPETKVETIEQLAQITSFDT